MKTLTLRAPGRSNTTIIENEFIDTYMARANGEYVKTYLYLIRHLNTPDTCISISTIADNLETTEKDILRALKYWEKQGLLAIESDHEGKICGLDIATISVNNVGTLPHTQIPSVAPISGSSKPIPNTTTSKAVITPISSATTRSRKEFKQTLFVAEQYLGKTLTKTDVEKISYFYDTLHFPCDLIEYLIEYCVENNHNSIHYIHAVALNWFNTGITTVSDAKSQILTYNKDYYTVLKAFGITGRGPISTEKEFVDKWTLEYGFTLEMVTEACTRTIATIHQPSFEYTDSILKSWKKSNVFYKKDLEVLDKQYKDTKSNKKKATDKTKTTFNNFQPRDYDIATLEQELLKM